jgi:type IV pilus assembly protein PilM
LAKNRITTIDIGTNSVKVLQLELSQSDIMIANFGVEHYPRQSASDKLSDEVVIDTLSHLLREKVISTKPVAMSIPRYLVTVKNLIGLPASASEDDIKKMVPIQVEPELPFSIAESVQSSYNIQRSQDGISLEVVAAKKSSVQRYLDISDELGLKLSAIIPSSLATYAVVFDQFKESLSGKTIAVADIGAGMTDICIIEHGRLAFSRSFPLGGNNLTDAFQKEYGLADFQQAEERKLRDANLLTNDENPAHRWADNMTTQLSRSFLAFRGERSSDNVDSLWLCGGGSRLTGLDTYLADKLKMPVNPWNPLSKIQSQKPDEDLQWSMSVPLGLGIIGMVGATRVPTVNANLLPKEISQREERARQKIRMYVFAILAFVVIAGAGLGFIGWRSSKAAEIQKMTAKLETLEKKEVIHSAKSALENSILMQKMVAPYVTPLEVLREMSNKLPDRKKVALTNLSIDTKGKLTMGVEATSHGDISEMIQILSEIKLLDEVNLFDEVKHGVISRVTKDNRPILQVQVACALNQDAMQEIR